METRTHHGSCFCGAVEFQADIDLSRGPARTDCAGPRALRWWSVVVKPDAFHSISGESVGCCPRCSGLAYRKVEAAGWNDGAYYAVNVAALDDLDPGGLIASTVRICDGRSHDADRTWRGSVRGGLQLCDGRRVDEPEVVEDPQGRFCAIQGVEMDPWDAVPQEFLGL